VKVFISWSGERSHTFALALAQWLQMMLQAAKPFVSSELDKGVRWMSEIMDELDTTSFGILCLTPENIRSSWIAFEAGALSKALPGGKSRVVPVALGLASVADVPPPLGLFQGMLATRTEFKALVNTMNAILPNPLAQKTLDQVFNAVWPQFEAKLATIQKTGSAANHDGRSDTEKLDELLAILRTSSSEILHSLDKTALRLRTENASRQEIVEFILRTALFVRSPYAVKREHVTFTWPRPSRLEIISQVPISDDDTRALTLAFIETVEEGIELHIATPNRNIDIPATSTSRRSYVAPRDWGNTKYWHRVEVLSTHERRARSVLFDRYGIDPTRIKCCWSSKDKLEIIVSGGVDEGMRASIGDELTATIQEGFTLTFVE
jgi:hypothetical protein